MKKYLLIMFTALLILPACGTTVEGEPERKETISNEETMQYLERLLDPYVKLTEIETEDQAYEIIEEMDEKATEITRELKRDYEKDIHAVDDLLALADIYNNVASEVADDNLIFVQGLGQDLGSQIGKIAIDYLDGELPDNYAEMVGANNIYDLE